MSFSQNVHKPLSTSATSKGAYWDGACWQVGTIDSLHMTLKWTNSNRYRRIRDLAPAASKDYGFRQTSSNLSSYQYDANGNLILDLNKNMDGVYNYLNLPERIEFDDCKVIEFTYDANGTKLRKELKNGAMPARLLNNSASASKTTPESG